jgi:hypothetical protein
MGKVIVNPEIVDDGQKDRESEEHCYRDNVLFHIFLPVMLLGSPPLQGGGRGGDEIEQYYTRFQRESDNS